MSKSKLSVRNFILFFIFSSLIFIAACGGGSCSGDYNSNVKILVTADLHSGLLPYYSDNGKREGGYARIKTIIDEKKVKYPHTLVLDGGDFSAGSLFQTTYMQDAIELRALGALGVDYTTFGNHEFDYGAEGIANMLTSAMKSGQKLPKIIQSMFLPDKSSKIEGVKKAYNVFNQYGIKKYDIVEKNGIYFVIFSSYGINASVDSPASQMSPSVVTLDDRINSANEIIQTATKECQEKYGKNPIVICLSHAGIKSEDDGEDIDLAKSVSGIDLIISAHEHLKLENPVIVGNTYIVSVGYYGKNIGEVFINYSDNEEGKRVDLVNFKLISINSSVEENESMNTSIQEYKSSINGNYLSYFGLTFDDIIINNPYSFKLEEDTGKSLYESRMGNIITDGNRKIAGSVTGKQYDVSIVPYGVIRRVLPKGNVTTSDIYNVVPLGIGNDGLSGYPLMETYLTGSELKILAQFDAISPSINADYQLAVSGLKYTINESEATVTAISLEDGSQIEDGKLYSVVLDTYTFSMASTLGKSFGITFKDVNGNEMSSSNVSKYIIRKSNGSELKEWIALLDYLKSMGGTISSYYSKKDGRKIVEK